MRKTLNLRYLARMIIVAGLLAGVLYAAHGFQERRNASSLKRRAERAQAEGHLDDAARYLGRYLGFVPGDTEALARYGLVQDQLSPGSPRAISSFDQVLRRDPKRSDIRRQLVKSAAAVRRFAEAKPHAKLLLAAKPDDGEILEILGRCEEAEANYPAAAATFEAATKADPTRLESFAAWAKLLRDRLGPPANSDQSARADRVMDAMITANARAFRAYLARARYREAYGLEGASKDVARAEELAPDEAEVILLAANLDSKRAGSGLDEGRRRLLRGIELHPKLDTMYLALAALERRAGRPDEAEQALRRGQKVLPGAVSLRWDLADLLVDLRRTKPARAAIEQLKADKLPSGWLEDLNARLEMVEGRWREAADLLEQARRQLAAGDALGWRIELDLGRCLERLYSPDLALAAYQRAVAAEPAAVEARLEVASALVAQGRIDDALRELDKVAPQATGVRPVMARLMAIRMTQLPAAQRRWDQVEAMLDRAEKETPGSVAVPLLRAQVAATQGQLQQTRKLIEDTCAAHPDSIEPRVALANVVQQTGQADEALALLDRAERDLGDTVELRLARAQHWSRRPGPRGREVLVKLADGLKRFPVEDQTRLLDALARTLAGLGATAEASRFYDELAKRQPNDLGICMAQFDLASRAADAAGMTQAAQRLRKIEGEEGTLWRFGEAVRLVRAGGATNLEGARQRLGEVASRRPSWSRVPLLQAEIAVAEEKPDRAIEAFQRAIAIGERNPAVVRQLVRLLYERRRFDEADAAIKGIQGETPVAGDLKRLSAEVSLNLGEDARALELAKEAIATDSKDYRDYVWLGRVLTAVNRPDDATAALRRAVALAPAEPEAWTALVQGLVRLKRPTEAESALREAQAKLPAATGALVAAQGSQALGHAKKAEGLYREALASRQDDPDALHGLADLYLTAGQFASAEPLLRRMIALGTECPPTEMSWARRALAVGLASTGGRAQFDEALSLSDANLRESQAVEDRQARAVILATRPERRGEAIELFEKLARVRPLPPDAQYLLAQLYEAKGDWSRVRELMLGLITSNGDNPKYLVAYADGLLRRNQAVEAEPWVDRLLEAEPTSIRSNVLKARVLKAQGRADEAAVRLVKLAGDQGLSPDALVALAAVLEEIGHGTEAEPLYRRFVTRAKRPEAALVLAEYLGRTGRVREALNLCSEARSSCPPAAIAHTCATILSTWKAGPEDYQIAEAMIEPATGTATADPAYLIPLAVLRAAQGRPRDAEAYYRQTLAANPKHLVALNNLAWMMAFDATTGDEALSLIGRAIALAGPDPALLDTRAVIHSAMGHHDLAIKDLDEAIAKRPLPSMQAHLARARLGSGDRPGAIAALRRAEEMGLKPGDLDPVEREGYDRLRAELGRP